MIKLPSHLYSTFNRFCTKHSGLVGKIEDNLKLQKSESSTLLQRVAVDSFMFL